ncbi:MAG: hypothetical protein JWO96_644 [Candidatus Saccharibacteria bacterium]|nr:hypothetical protein [Candidatus Saccharibacteria bacterium]
MDMARIVRVVRNVEFNRLFDDFFISAISTILIIRFFLKLSGYPQIGGSDLHISHLLPGILLLLTAFLLLLAAVNRAVRDFSAMLGGIGFGFVWDELGKFITKDNNYFFKATPGLIYITFVALYLIVRWAAQKRFTQDDYLANVLDLIKDSAVKDLDQREYEHAHELFAHVSREHPLYAPTKLLLEAVEPSVQSERTLVDRATDIVTAPLHYVSLKRGFPRLVLGISFLYGLACLAGAVFFFVGAFHDKLQLDFTILKGEQTDVVGAISMLASAVFVVIGAVRYLHGRHRRAYRFFEQALLVNIFVGEIVLFFKSPVVAIAALAATLILLFNLQILIADSKRRHSA